jgi:hypothetical protein
VEIPMMLRPGFGAGDILGSAIAVFGLTLLLLITESHVLVGFTHFRRELAWRQASLLLARKHEPVQAADWLRMAEEQGDLARYCMKVGLGLVPLAAIGLGLACFPPLRSLMRRVGLLHYSKQTVTAGSHNRALRIYLRLLLVSQILAAVLYALILVGLLSSTD